MIRQQEVENSLAPVGLANCDKRRVDGVGDHLDPHHPLDVDGYIDLWRYRGVDTGHSDHDQHRYGNHAGHGDQQEVNADQLRELIQDTLRALEPEIPYSEAAVELLMLTAAVESNLGEYIKQVRGPARGIFQMEPRTAHCIHTNWLVYKQDLLQKVNQFANRMDPDLQARGDLVWQIVWARLHYRRVPKPLPEIRFMRGERKLTNRSVQDLAKYWKEHFNTYLGKGTVHKAVAKYWRYAA